MTRCPLKSTHGPHFPGPGPPLSETFNEHWCRHNIICLFLSDISFKWWWNINNHGFSWQALVSKVLFIYTHQWLHESEIITQVTTWKVNTGVLFTWTCRMSQCLHISLQTWQTKMDPRMNTHTGDKISSDKLQKVHTFWSSCLEYTHANYRVTQISNSGRLTHPWLIRNRFTWHILTWWKMYFLQR